MRTPVEIEREIFSSSSSVRWATYTNNNLRGRQTLELQASIERKSLWTSSTALLDERHHDVRVSSLLSARHQPPVQPRFSPASAWALFRAGAPLTSGSAPPPNLRKTVEILPRFPAR
jgi:hypothetical protein